MREKRSHRDEFLFLWALGALLVGVGLLLRTTGVARTYGSLLPIAIVAVGGVLCWFALARGGHSVLFSGGVFLALLGCLALAAAMAGWKPGRFWPLAMSCAGIAWMTGGLRHYRRPRMTFLVPSAAFTLLGLFFALFSFKIVGVGLGAFIAEWWPSFIIAGGVVLFIAWGASSRTLPSRRPGKRR